MVMLICSVIAGLAGLCATFAAKYHPVIFFVCKTIIAFANDGAMSISTVYVMEMASPR